MKVMMKILLNQIMCLWWKMMLSIPKGMPFCITIYLSQCSSMVCNEIILIWFSHFRIKLFEMEGKKFKDLGVGNLFVKPLSSGKNQLLIRADNSLGTILVNALLNASTPIRQNKPTNILITLPSADGKPITYLMRVKDATLGNELTQALEKYKSQQQS